MDRQIVYPGSIPLDTDLLTMQRNVMRVVGTLAQAILGPGGVADGMACLPGPTGYSVQVTPGSYTVLSQVDAAPFGSLPADGTPLVRTGQHLDTTVLQLSAPPDSGSVGCFLVQLQMQEVDTGPVALPYWNAANPQVAFSGPGNSGLAQNTRREMRVVLGVKGSVQPGAAGTVPDADAGWAGLYGVTTRLGQPGIAASDIVPVSQSGFLRFKLPSMPPGYSQQAVFSAGGIWAAPSGVRWVRVRVLGGGGGGGGGDASFSGGGGGAGGYAESVLPVVPLRPYAVTVGASGATGATGSSGGAGGTSDFAGLVTATGGQGGGSANPDSHGGSPGTGSAGGILLAGGFGGDGAAIAKVPGGNGGASALGGGGRGANQGGPPATGLAAGAGGGGGYGAASPGGPGAGGLVIIDF